MRSIQCARGLFAAASALAASACSQSDTTKSAEAVTLQPGRYKVELLDGRSSSRAKAKGSTVCLSQRETASFPYKMAESYYELQPGCTSTRDPQQGGAIAGKITCPTDQKIATGTSSFVYTGKVAADAVTVSGHIKIDPNLDTSSLSQKEAAQLKLGAAMMERVKIDIKATRIGSCN